MKCFTSFNYPNEKKGNMSHIMLWILEKRPCRILMVGLECFLISPILIIFTHNIWLFHIQSKCVNFNDSLNDIIINIYGQSYKTAVFKNVFYNHKYTQKGKTKNKQ